MSARQMIRDETMRRAALCSRLERRSRSAYGYALVVLAGVLAALAVVLFSTPCQPGALC